MTEDSTDLLDDPGGVLARDGVLSRWLAVDSLDTLCRVVYDDLHRSLSVHRFLIVLYRAGRLSGWALEPRDEGLPVAQLWYDLAVGLESPPTPYGIDDAGGAPAEDPEPLSPPAELQLGSSCAVEAAPGIVYRIYWNDGQAEDVESGVAVPHESPIPPLGESSTGQRGVPRTGMEECCRSGEPLHCALELALSNLARIDRIRELSHIDTLTGTFNRRHFNLRLTAEIDRARRFERPLSLMIADLDGFKVLNDTHGHQAGDIALRYVAQSIRCSVRSIDVLCRLGGDEFAVLMPDTDAEHCAVLADRLRGVVAQREFPIGGSGEPARFRLSLGGAVFPLHAEKAERLLWCADMALLEAKRQAGDRFVIFDRAFCEKQNMQWQPVYGDDPSGEAPSGTS